MTAYWDADQRCRFANEAYWEWFGKSRAEMIGLSLAELLGPLYQLNLPHIQEALRGHSQVFERTIPLPDGRVKQTLATYTPDIVDNHVRGFFVHVADVTVLKELELELKAAKAQAEKLATHDYLTGLPNRVMFQERFAQAAAVAERNAGLMALMMIDMDGFKNINDTFGHAEGDSLLTLTAHRMSSIVPDSATLARMGGDEFILLCVDIDAVGAAEVANRLLASVREPVTCHGVILNPSLSIGIAMYPEHGITQEALMIAADKAMYRAKRRRDTYIDFASSDSPPHG